MRWDLVLGVRFIVAMTPPAVDVVVIHASIAESALLVRP